MHRHAKCAEGGSGGIYRVGTGIEGEKTIVDNNGTLRVGRAVVSRLFSSSFSFSEVLSAANKNYHHCLLVFNPTQQYCQQKNVCVAAATVALLMGKKDIF
jgi:hypothetical protein